MIAFEASIIPFLLMHAMGPDVTAGVLLAIVG